MLPGQIAEHRHIARRYVYIHIGIHMCICLRVYVCENRLENTTYQPGSRIARSRSPSCWPKRTFARPLRMLFLPWVAQCCILLDYLSIRVWFLRQIAQYSCGPSAKSCEHTDDVNVTAFDDILLSYYASPAKLSCWLVADTAIFDV